MQEIIGVGGGEVIGIRQSNYILQKCKVAAIFRDLYKMKSLYHQEQQQKPGLTLNCTGYR